MWKANNEDLLKQVEFMSKEEAEKEKEHDAEMANVIAKVKASIVIVVWEAKIRLAEDVSNIGSWNLTRWRATLAELKVEFVKTDEYPEEPHHMVNEE